MDQQKNTADVKQPKRGSGAWRHVLLAVVIFVCGVLVGAGASVWVVHRGVMKVMGHGMPKSGVLIAHIDSQLDLTEDQEAQIEAIFEREFGVVREKRREISSELRLHFERIRDDVAEVLTDEQREVWLEEIGHAEKMFMPFHRGEHWDNHAEYSEHVSDHPEGHGGEHNDGDSEQESGE